MATTSRHFLREGMLLGSFWLGNRNLMVVSRIKEAARRVWIYRMTESYLDE